LSEISKSKKHIKIFICLIVGVSAFFISSFCTRKILELSPKNHQTKTLVATKSEKTDRLNPDGPNLPIFAAIEREELGEIGLILELEPQALNSIYKGKTPIEFAVSNGSIPATKKLIEASLDINNENWFARNSLVGQAVKSGNLELIKLLKENGCRINLRDIAGKTPLHYAVCLNDPAIVEFLLANGAEVDLREYSNGETPFLLATSNVLKNAKGTGTENVIKIFKALIKYGADTNKRTWTGCSAFFRANVRNTPSEIIEFLGAICPKDQLLNGWPNIEKFVRTNDLDELEKSFKLYPESVHFTSIFHHKLNSAIGAVFYAAAEGKIDLLKLLLANGGNPNQRTLLKGCVQAPIHIAIRRNHKEIVEYLLEDDKVLPNLLDENGDSLLHYSAAVNSLDLIEIFKQKGLNPHRRNRDGKLAIELAKPNFASIALLKWMWETPPSKEFPQEVIVNNVLNQFPRLLINLLKVFIYTVIPIGLFLIIYKLKNSDLFFEFLDNKVVQRFSQNPQKKLKELNRIEIFAIYFPFVVGVFCVAFPLLPLLVDFSEWTWNNTGRMMLEIMLWVTPIGINLAGLTLLALAKLAINDREKSLTGHFQLSFCFTFSTFFICLFMPYFILAILKTIKYFADTFGLNL